MIIKYLCGGWVIRIIVKQYYAEVKQGTANGPTFPGYS